MLVLCLPVNFIQYGKKNKVLVLKRSKIIYEIKIEYICTLAEITRFEEIPRVHYIQKRGLL